MLISHKHKLIFIKTHKTSTQTFNNFMRDHVGPDDVITGDPNHGTEINIDKKFDTGLCAEDFKETYGNHLPWFMVKEIVGDSIWNDYLKITIEREPMDRILSLFCFLNPQLVSLKCKINKQFDWEDKKQRKEISQLTPLKFVPDGVRNYFWNWVDVQLEADVLPLTDHVTYSATAVPLELNKYREAGARLGVDIFFYDKPNKYMLPVGSQHLCDFPDLGTEKILITDQNHRNENHPAYKRYLSLEGQCRFLNYGYYYDGEQTHVDHVIPYTNVAENIGTCFEHNNIDIECNKELYDTRSKNVHFRKSFDLPKNSWWYEEKKGEIILNKINTKLKKNEIFD